MYNASYLIRSRHAIYYFRYPLPQHDNKRVSISLKTRCPKEALRLSKALEYHAFMVMNNPEMQSLDYAEVKEILRNNFAEVLERMKRAIDKDGALSVERVEALRRLQSDAQYAIDRNYDEFHEELLINDDIREELTIDNALRPIAERNGISLDQDSKERTALRREYKHALNGYIEALLAYNDSAGYYDYSMPVSGKTTSRVNRSELKLENVIAAYLKDNEGKIGNRGYREKQDCTNYLLEVFGEDCLITDIDYPKVREVKDMLVGTPANRNKLAETKGLPLERQIEVAKEQSLKPMSDTNVNKYLGYMSGLFKWTKQNKYVSENPFEGVKVKADKNKVRRVAFKPDEVRRILDGAAQIDTSKGLEKVRYWAVLLYVFTGARLNEIASLTLDDIKQHNGIWYLSITDEEETKRLKTGAAKRFVPIHSKLDALGFFDYVEHVRGVVAKKPKTGEYNTRLLYALKYNEDGGWGRGIGRWINNVFLPSLKLKGEGQVLHSLRHSFITSLNDAGVQAQEIMALVGHEQGTVTFAKYAKFGEEHLHISKEAIEKLGY